MRRIHKWARSRTSDTDQLYGIGWRPIVCRRCDLCGLEQHVDRTMVVAEQIPESLWHLADVVWQHLPSRRYPEPPRGCAS